MLYFILKGEREKVSGDEKVRGKGQVNGWDQGKEAGKGEEKGKSEDEFLQNNSSAHFCVSV